MTPASDLRQIAEHATGDEELLQEEGSCHDVRGSHPGPNRSETVDGEPKAGPALTLATGQRVTHYILLSKLGEGAMGVVWRVLDTRLNREVALKQLPADLARDPERRLRFEREARAVASINHPHVLTIHSIESAGDLSFMITELVEGDTLREMLLQGPLPLARFLDLSIQLADGVQAAHECGVTHRDLNPGNVMVNREGRVKILDFGLAKVHSGPVVQGLSAEQTITEEGRILGTVPYMSPEQAKGKDLDSRSDLFSLGSLLYELITGRRPFQGETVVEVLSSILMEDPVPVTRHDPTLPGRLEDILAGCLEKKPEDRVPTALALRQQLEQLRHEVNTGGDPGSSFAPRRLKSIAVLPLANLSGDPAQDYFADGMTEALITDLARIDGLRVISRTSMMQFKGTSKSIPEIAQQLDVDTALEGSIIRSGDRVRITVDLIQARTDSHLWAETYERHLRDILSVHSEVAQAIAREIQIQLSPETRSRLRVPRPVNPEAHEEYLRGRYHWNRRTEMSLERGIEHFQAAIEADPVYPLAHVGLADSYNILGFYGYRPSREAFPRAEAAAKRALEIDRDLPEAQVSLAYAKHYHDWDWPEAERLYRRAIALNPGYSIAHQWYFNFLVSMGRMEEALAEAVKARSLDPLSLIIQSAVGWVHFFRRDYDSALAELGKAQELDPTFALGRLWCGWAHERKGCYKEALAELAQACLHAPGAPIMDAFRAHALALSGNPAEARSILGELAQAAKSRYVSPFLFAMVRIGLGENDRALECLLAAFEERSHWLVFLDVDPRLDPLREDPRFQDLRERIGLSSV